MDLNHELSTAHDTTLLEMLKEIKEFKETGILCNGLFRALVKAFAVSVNQDAPMFFMLVERDVLFELAMRYKAVREKEKKV